MLQHDADMRQGAARVPAMISKSWELSAFDDILFLIKCNACSQKPKAFLMTISVHAPSQHSRVDALFLDARAAPPTGGLLLLAVSLRALPLRCWQRAGCPPGRPTRRCTYNFIEYTSCQSVCREELWGRRVRGCVWVSVCHTVWGSGA